MKTATVAESKENWGDLLPQVKAGESVLIYENDIPVAGLEPVSPSSLPDDLRLRSLESRGLVRRGSGGADLLKELNKFPLGPVVPGRSGSDAVIAEREEGR